MATSGDFSWALTRNDLIEAAYRKLGIPGEDNTLTTAQTNDGAEALNAVIALAVTDGMSLWKRAIETVTPSATTQLYTVDGAVKVTEVYLRDTSTLIQYDLQNKSFYDFNNLPRTTSSVPVAYYAQPTISGCTVQIWPYTSDSDTVANKEIDIVYQLKFDTFTAAGEDLDFPSHWTQAIIYRTAVALAPEYGIPIQDRQLLLQESKIYWEEASSYDDEEGSLFIQPNTRMR